MSASVQPPAFSKSEDFQLGVHVGRLVERLERKQRFDMVVPEKLVEFARAIAVEHKYVLMETHYADVRSRIWGAPAHLPKDPTPPPTGSPVQVRIRQAA